jgi:hypothetical protein
MLIVDWLSLAAQTTHRILIRTEAVLFALDSVEALLRGSDRVDELLDIEVSGLETVVIGFDRTDVVSNSLGDR